MSQLSIFGLWGQEIIPLELTLYNAACDQRCAYCFTQCGIDSEAGGLPVVRPAIKELESTAKKIAQAFSAEADLTDPIEYCLRQKYPIAFSNNTDPFQRRELKERVSEVFLQLAIRYKLPIYFETKGYAIAKDPDKYIPLIESLGDNCWVYLSLGMLDDAVRQTIEPNAPMPEERLRVIRQLSDVGIRCTVAINPYVPEWCEDPCAIVDAATEAGAKAIYISRLHAFPGLRKRWKVAPGVKVNANLAESLSTYLVIKERCEANGIAFTAPDYVELFLGMPSWGDRVTFSDGKPWPFHSLHWLRDVQRFEREVQKPVLVTWRMIEQWYREKGIENPVMKSQRFWKRKNIMWNHCVGKVASMFDIMRFHWNNPQEVFRYGWYAPQMFVVCSQGHKRVVGGVDMQDCIGVFSTERGSANMVLKKREWITVPDGALPEGAILWKSKGGE